METKSFFYLFVLLLFYGCSDDKGLDETDNRSGEPYKFRVELSTDEPELFSIGWGTGNYKYIDKDFPVPITVWFTPDDLEEIPSPCIKEFEIPGNFIQFSLLSALVSIDPTISDSFEGIIKGKLYINNNMITEFSHKFSWGVGITYNSNSKKYTVSASNENFELNKLE